MKKIILIILVLLIIFSKESLSKYFSTININVNGNVIDPIIEVEHDNTVILNSSEVKMFFFKIKNYKDEENINEIDLDYYIEFITDSSEILNIKLYKNEEEIKIDNNKTDSFLLEKGKKQDDVFRLEVFIIDTFFKEIEDIIKIKIYCEQKN